LLLKFSMTMKVGSSTKILDFILSRFDVRMSNVFFWSKCCASWILQCQQTITCYLHFVDIASDTHVCTFHDSRYSSLLFSSFLLLFLFTIFNFVNVCCCTLQIQNHCWLKQQINAHRSAAVMC
jgi:hypothetical protein